MEKAEANIKARETAELMMELAADAAADVPGQSVERFWETLSRMAADRLPRRTANSHAAGPTKLCDHAAAVFGRSLVPARFRKYAGRRVDEVPLDYWVYLTEHADEFLTTVRRYLASDRVQREMERTEGGREEPREAQR